MTVASAANTRQDRSSFGRIVLLAVALLLSLFVGATARVWADDGCDQSEDVACLPLPPDTPSPDGPMVANGAAAAVGAAVAPVPIGQPCPAAGAGAMDPFAAVPAIPVSVCGVGSAPPSGWCSAPLNSAAAQEQPAAAVAVPVPPPVACSPYRSIYATINRGNAADVRALRTLSADGLSTYWRRDALSQIENQIAQLELSGVNASARLYSIQLRERSVSLATRTATVHTLEHWYYRQRSLDDGSVVYSADQWVDNIYGLSFIGNVWYIVSDSTTLTAGPQPLPASAG